MRPGLDRLLRAVASARVTSDEELHRRLRPQLSQSAARRLAPGEMLNLSADLRVDLGEILMAVGQRDQARTPLREAVDRYERKGNVVGARRTRELAT